MKKEILELYKRATLLSPLSLIGEPDAMGKSVTFADKFGSYEEAMVVCEREKCMAVEQLFSKAVLLYEAAKGGEVVLPPVLVGDESYEVVLAWCEDVLRCLDVISESDKVYFTPIRSGGNLWGYRRQKGEGDGDKNSGDRNRSV